MSLKSVEEDFRPCAEYYKESNEIAACGSGEPYSWATSE